MKYAIRVIGNGSRIDPDAIEALSDDTRPAWWISAFDPEGNSGIGVIELTQVRDRALLFDSAFDALEAYKTIPESRPLRDDGKPNRPMTAYSISVEVIP